MPVHHAIWRVGENPQPLTISKLASEQLLEKMILNDPTILSDQWMIIGHQENTLDKGRIDLLAIAPDGSLVLIELKRDCTPREVVARVKTVLRRAREASVPAEPGPLTVGGLSLDEARREITVDGRPVALSTRTSAAFAAPSATTRWRLASSGPSAASVTSSCPKEATGEPARRAAYAQPPAGRRRRARRAAGRAGRARAGGLQRRPLCA